MDPRYETVVGLEVHAQLLTESKLFCGDATAFGAEPNSQISPITLGYPGTLPVLNRAAVVCAIKMGLACHAEIEKSNYFARKNYFYPDLPKGYQISQHTTPVCKGGFVAIRTPEGEKKIELNRIHLEEDAGKSIHDLYEEATCLDFNRAGTPLIEIVTEPCLSGGDDAYAYLTALRRTLRYLGVCDGNMEEGSLRCDANVSVRRRGETALGTKVEVKNLNSIRNVKRAIEAEAERLVSELEAGRAVVQETRSFDAAAGTTFSMRTKEDANDYRYFPDPDLPPFHLTEEFLHGIRAGLPALPEALAEKYTRTLGLPQYDADVLTDEKETSDYFEAVIAQTQAYKAAANWVLGPVKSWCNEKGVTLAAPPLPADTLARLVALVESGKVNFSIASSRLFPALVDAPAQDPEKLAVSMNLVQTGDPDQIRGWIEQALGNLPDKVIEYRKGKKGLMGLFVGEVKKISKGKADPRLTSQLLSDVLDK